jgi:hypothetical protein
MLRRGQFLTVSRAGFAGECLVTLIMQSLFRPELAKFAPLTRRIFVPRAGRPGIMLVT